MSHRPPVFKLFLLHAALALAILAVCGWLWRTGSEQAKPATVAAPTPSLAPAPPTLSAPLPEVVAKMKTFDDFRPKPFAVASESTRHQWTKEDGRDPGAILDLAHNDLEVQRLMEENARIERRQLIYRQEPAWVLVEQARSTGEPLRKLTLPALDGREVEMEVTRANVEPSGMSGSFEGRIAGREQSLVTLAFIKGREAFTVVSPEDGTYLQGHPREAGEVIVTSFLPEKYLARPGGEPIRTAK